MPPEAGPALPASAPASSSAAPPSPPPDRTVDVVIVGAGLAGLSAAHTLRKAGLSFKIFESEGRAGGRIFTDRKTFAPQSMTCEIGAELIDSNHQVIRALCQEKGLEIVDLKPVSSNPAADTLYYFGKKKLHEKDLLRQLKPVVTAMRADLKKIGDISKPYQMAGALQELDRLSVDQWMARHKVGGEIGELLKVAFRAEFGLETSQLSCIPMLQTFVEDPDSALKLFGESDERYWIKGGNDSICKALADDFQEELSLKTAVERVRPEADNSRLVVSFTRDGKSQEVKARRVIVAVPFTVLRRGMLSDLPLSGPKKKAIQEFDLGTNAKLSVGFTKRFWQTSKASGEIFSDLPFQTSWDATRGQPGQAGIMTNFLGGAAGKAMDRTQAGNMAASFLKDLEEIFGKKVGVSALAIRDGVSVADWPRSPVGGSYSVYQVGQLSSFGGCQGEPEGMCHFAGEHTSTNFQGFMEGAAESGKRAAGEIVTALGRKTP